MRRTLSSPKFLCLECILQKRNSQHSEFTVRCQHYRHWVSRTWDYHYNWYRMITGEVNIVRSVRLPSFLVALMENRKRAAQILLDSEKIGKRPRKLINSAMPSNWPLGPGDTLLLLECIRELLADEKMIINSEAQNLQLCKRRTMLKFSTTSNLKKHVATT